MPLDIWQKEKNNNEFPSAHALLDITCKIAVTPQQRVAFASSCTDICMSTRSMYLQREQNRKATTNRVFVNLHVFVKVALPSP